MNYPPDTTDSLWEGNKRENYLTHDTTRYLVGKELFPILEKNSIIVSSVSGYSLEGVIKKRGPWIRSFPNYVFKLILLELRKPIVFLLDEHKWNRDMQEGRSINLLPAEYLGNEKELPICYVLATYDKDKCDEFIAYFQGIGFSKKRMIDKDYKNQAPGSGIIYGAAMFTSSFNSCFS